MGQVKVCGQYDPNPEDGAYCKCRLHWNLHPLAARESFFKNAPASSVQKMIDACKRDNEFPCSKYTPKHDWQKGVRAPDCVCGRPPMPSHPPGDVLRGVRAWKEAHGLPTLKEPCGSFYGTIMHPGICVVCERKWLHHTASARPLVIEAFSDLHQGWCKCIMMNGDVECSCMTNDEKQEALDRLAKTSKPASRKGSTVSCKNFRPKSQANTGCQCGEPFYLHSKQACDGYSDYTSWRASHMSNHELLTWFMQLPGKNRYERLQSAKRFMTDPHFNLTPPVNMVNPCYNSVRALLDALDNTHYIQSPTDLEKNATADAQVIHIEDLPLNTDAETRKHLCYSCGEMTSNLAGNVCDGCSDYLDTLAKSHNVSVPHNFNDDKKVSGS